MYRFVADVLKAKGNQVWTITPDKTVYEALQLLAAKNVGALVVVEQDKVAGIFTERDYARKCILQGKHSQKTPVHELMTKDVLCVGPAESIENCMALMTTGHVRHLPVLDQGRLAGLVSIGDVVKGVISEREFTIRELNNYIYGTR